MDKETSTPADFPDWSPASLTEAAVSILGRRLPARWSAQAQPSASNPADWEIVVRSEVNNGQSALMVEARRSFVPREVAGLTGGLFRRLRERNQQVPILLVAPYISSRARELLTENDINYLDLTGNIRIALDYPGLFVASQGAQTDPTPTARGARGLRGAKVGAVVRALVDAKPPYTGTQLAKAAQVNEGYVSRILDTLLDDGLITRPKSGPVLDADWTSLLRRRAAALSLFRAAGSYRYIARDGSKALLRDLAGFAGDNPPVVTGSYAASRLAPIAPPTQLVLYSLNPRALAASLRLVEVETGADTVLIRPDNLVVFRGAQLDDFGLRFAAPSQVAIDCLSGSGRMPAEGEAVLEWMKANENAWRAENVGRLLEIGNG